MQAKDIAAAVKLALAFNAGEPIPAHPEYDAFVAEAECRRMSGLSRSERWRRIHAGTFPAPIHLGRSRCTRWSLRDLLDWQRAVIERSRGAA